MQKKLRWGLILAFYWHTRLKTKFVPAEQEGRSIHWVERETPFQKREISKLLNLKTRMGSPAKRHQITFRETQDNKRKGKKSHGHKKKSREKRENIQESKRRCGQQQQRAWRRNKGRR